MPQDMNLQQCNLLQKWAKVFNPQKTKSFLFAMTKNIIQSRKVEDNKIKKEISSRLFRIMPSPPQKFSYEMPFLI